MVAAASGGTNGAMAAAAFAAEIVGGLWLETRWRREGIDRVVASVASATGVDRGDARAAIFAAVVRNEYLYELPTRLALEAQLKMLVVFGAAKEASLWTRDKADQVVCVLEVGGHPSRRAVVTARQVVTTNDVVTTERAQLQGAPIRRWNRAEGAIVVRAPVENRTVALAYAAECALAARPLLEIENLLSRRAEQERALVEATDRRLARLGFDLHDGPMQDIAALAQDLRLYRAQLAPFLAPLPESEILLGRLDDLDARLLSMDAELRELARSLHEPSTVQTPFDELLRKDVARFTERSKVRVDVETSGELTSLTSSQKIALLRVVQEALNNVHEHSGARNASVAVAGTATQLEAVIVDDGRGFDVESKLIEAAKAGRLGLVGMSERVRLLGGRLDVTSRRGGPTRVHATVPRWEPLETDAEQASD